MIVNIVCFCAGLAVGVGIIGMIYIWLLGQATKDSSRRQSEFGKETAELMRARNATDAEIEKHLKVLADWCSANWVRK